MKIKIKVDHEAKWENGCFISTPIYKEFFDMKSANDFIQNYLETTDFSVVGVTSLSDECIELYFDVV